MTRFFAAMSAILVILFTFPAMAKCEGPVELCAQITQLQAELETRKKETQSVKAEDDKKVTALQDQQKTQDQRTIKFIGIMSTLAIVLKILLSLMTAWKDTLFQSDKGKAGIRIAILSTTLGIFLATNMGFGIPWWQALILAAGGPLSMVIHEMMKLIPVVRGKGKLPADPVQPDPPQDSSPPAPAP